jgi:hypothetical protein
MFSEKYQWIKGDKVGNVELYSSHDNEWVYFTGGNRINSSLISEYMMQVASDTPLDLSITKQDLRSTPTKHADISPVKRQDEFNPVKSLLKQAAKTKHYFSYTFDADIPKQQVYNLIQDSFETNIDDLLIDMVMSTINKNELYENVKVQLREQILKIYNNGKQSEPGESGSNEKSDKHMGEQETEKILS